MLIFDFECSLGMREISYWIQKCAQNLEKVVLERRNVGFCRTKRQAQVVSHQFGFYVIYSPAIVSMFQFNIQIWKYLRGKLVVWWWRGGRLHTHMDTPTMNEQTIRIPLTIATTNSVMLMPNMVPASLPANYNNAYLSEENNWGKFELSQHCWKCNSNWNVNSNLN